jgi:hypothetical protein
MPWIKVPREVVVGKVKGLEVSAQMPIRRFLYGLIFLSATGDNKPF